MRAIIFLCKGLFALNRYCRDWIVSCSISPGAGSSGWSTRVQRWCLWPGAQLPFQWRHSECLESKCIRPPGLWNHLMLLWLWCLDSVILSGLFVAMCYLLVFLCIAGCDDVERFNQEAPEAAAHLPDGVQATRCLAERQFVLQEHMAERLNLVTSVLCPS
jgi:hypothetical protein